MTKKPAKRDIRRLKLEVVAGNSRNLVHWSTSGSVDWEVVLRRSGYACFAAGKFKEHFLLLAADGTGLSIARTANEGAGFGVTAGAYRRLWHVPAICAYLAAPCVDPSLCRPRSRAALAVQALPAKWPASRDRSKDRSELHHQSFAKWDQRRKRDRCSLLELWARISL